MLAGHGAEGEVVVDEKSAAASSLASQAKQFLRRGELKIESVASIPVHLIEVSLLWQEKGTVEVDTRGMSDPLRVEHRMAHVKIYERETEVRLTRPKHQQAIPPPAIDAHVQIALLRPSADGGDQGAFATARRPCHQQLPERHRTRILHVADRGEVGGWQQVHGHHTGLTMRHAGSWNTSATLKTSHYVDRRQGAPPRQHHNRRHGAVTRSRSRGRRGAAQQRGSVYRANIRVTLPRGDRQHGADVRGTQRYRAHRTGHDPAHVQLLGNHCTRRHGAADRGGGRREARNCRTGGGPCQPAGPQKACGLRATRRTRLWA